MEKKRAVFRRVVRKHTEDSPAKRVKDTLVAEEPFTLVWESNDGQSERLGSTMRTPGDDLSLAAGMLFSEGTLLFKKELHMLSFCASGAVNELNRLKAELRLSASEIRARLGHRPSASLPQSACGLCGVDDLSNPSVLLEWAAKRYSGSPVEPPGERLLQALTHLEESCPLFSATGASHACVILAADGARLSSGEDVGRHNACDKAIGSLLLADERQQPFQLPAESGLLVSSRFSFELAHKATAAGVAWMASVGAPTHLAVELAERCGIPMFGFVSRRRFNRYV
jgi:FdhD protein